MSTTVEFIKKYIKDNYDINFTLDKTLRWLSYTKNKITYSIYCQYVYDSKDQVHNWCICIDVMDKNKLWGYDNSFLDNGIDTIEQILRDEFHLIKNEYYKQISLF